jgi:hypothetical protein
MDAVGCRAVMRAARAGGILHWLAAVGARDTQYRDADYAVSVYECRAGCGRIVYRPHRMEEACAQPRHTSGDPCERYLLSSPSNNHAAASVAGCLYGCTPLRSIFVVGIRWRLARRCNQAGHGRRVHSRYAHDAEHRTGGEIVEQALTVDRLMNEAGWARRIRNREP